MITPVHLDPKILSSAMVFILCGCASTFDQDNALAIAPYHILIDGRIVVEARVNDQGPFRFALDTGSSISVVFDELRNKLELEVVPGQWVTIHGAVASGKFPLLSVSRLQVGREIWADPRIASLPGETAAGATIDGLLGIDFLRGYAIGFSTKERIVRLYPPDLVSNRSYRGWAIVPLKPVNVTESGAALYFFEIEIDGQKVPALFDLGAGLNMINWPAARLLRFEPVGRREDELLSGALESTPVVAKINAKDVKTASIRWRDEEFLVADLEIFTMLPQGDSPLVILGSGLFNQRDFVIDFVRNRLLVKVAMDEVDNSR
ncbi:MAG: retroviral-like aspartic protease family protein [Gammaproteobacteria bacterium]